MNFWLYGYRQVAAAWEGLYSCKLVECGFERALSCIVFFYHAAKDISCVVHGDDFTFEGGVPDFFWIADEGDFMLQMLRTFDTDLSWSTVTANRDMKVVRELLMNPKLLPGFNDSGAHLTNMAFYDVNLRSLKLAAEGGEGDVSYMVKRLTKDAADVFGVAGGTIHQGDIFCLMNLVTNLYLFVCINLLFEHLKLWKCK